MTEWQSTFDEAFPQAVNVRLQRDGAGADDAIDFTAPCIIVLDGGYRLWFGDMGNNGKVFITTTEPVQVQDTPFPRFEVKDGDRTFWFWPRSLPADERDGLASMKERVKETARSYHGAQV